MIFHGSSTNWNLVSLSIYVILISFLASSLQLRQCTLYPYLVDLRRLAATNSSSKLVHPLLVQPSAADYIGFEAKYTYSRRNGKFYLMAVAQFQEQLTAFRFSPGLESNSHNFKKLKKFGFHTYFYNLPFC